MSYAFLHYCENTCKIALMNESKYESKLGIRKLYIMWRDVYYHLCMIFASKTNHKTDKVFTYFTNIQPHIYPNSVSNPIVC